MTPSSGLNLVLDIEQSYYMRKGISQAAGVRMAVYDPYIDLLPDEYGFDLPPSYDMKIKLPVLCM